MVMFPVPIGNFPPQEVWTSVDSGETYPMEWWWNNYVLTGNPDGTITAETKFSAGIPPMTLRRIESPPRPFMGLEYTTEFRGEADGSIIVGCGDGNSKSYNPDVEVHDIDQCGECLPGYTRTADTHCWKVGYRAVDCKTGQIYYKPLGYHQNCEKTGGKDRAGYCYVQDWDYYAGPEALGTTHLGKDVVSNNANWKGNATQKTYLGKPNYINTTYPSIYIRPRKGSPLNIAESGYWANSTRRIVAVRNDGEAVVVSGRGSKANWPGLDNKLTWQDIRDKGCEFKWVRLTDEDLAKVPTFLGSGGGLGTTKMIVIGDDDDDSNEEPIVRDPVGGTVEPEETNWTPLIAIGAVALALPILFGGRE
jgi:hypothetical protein